MGEFARIYKADLTDRQLAAVWEMVRNAGRDRDVMFGMPPMDGDAFAHWLRCEDVPAWLILFRSEPCGLFFLTDREGKTAHCHFVSLPFGQAFIIGTPTGKLPAVRGFGLYTLGAALWERTKSGGFILDTIIGIIPSCNEKALKLAERTGVRFHAVVPGLKWCFDTGENVPGVITTASRVEIPEWAATL